MIDTDVLIVGAGPAGLTLAVDLKRRGIGVTLIEKLAAPAPGSKGKGLQPRILEVFDDLGIIDEVLATAKPYPMLRFYDGMTVVGERAMFESKMPTEDAPYPNTLMLPQWLTETTLRRRFEALGGTVTFSMKLEALEDRGDHVAAMLSGPYSQLTVGLRCCVV
jgi:2-polyprenyl-6-methoxyphenol hydroxylase-like FAD-dependent oxidoreductase